MIDARVLAIHRLVEITGVPYDEMERRITFLETNEPGFVLADAVQQVVSVERIVDYIREGQ